MMMELPYEAWALLLGAACLAGLVRGFAGFGDALTYLPLAGLVLAPTSSLAVFTLYAGLGILPMVKSSWNEVSQDGIKPMLIALLVTFPIGFAGLLALDADIFRILLAIMALVASVPLLLGLKPKFPDGPRALKALGAVCGLVGGLTGVPGAILLVYFLGTTYRARKIRAFNMIFLAIFDLLVLSGIAVTGGLALQHAMIAALSVPLYMFGTYFGRKLFDPEREAAFRKFAVLVILASGILGLPIWNFAGH